MYVITGIKYFHHKISYVKFLLFNIVWMILGCVYKVTWVS